MKIFMKFHHSMVSPDNFEEIDHKTVVGKYTAILLPKMNLPVTGNGLLWTINLDKSRYHISGFSSPRFREVNRYGYSTIRFFERVTRNSIRLFIPWLGGYSDVSDKDTSKKWLCIWIFVLKMQPIVFLQLYGS